MNSRCEDVPVVPIFLEYLQVIIHTYLYHRHLYPSESFKLKKKYCIPVHVCCHIEVADYIVKVSEAIAVVLESNSFEQIEIYVKIDEVLVEKLLIRVPHLEAIKEREISEEVMFKLQEKLRCSLIVFAEKLNSLNPLTINQTLNQDHQLFSSLANSQLQSDSDPTWSVVMVTSMEGHLRVLQQQQLNQNLFWMIDDNAEYADNNITLNKQPHINEGTIQECVKEDEQVLTTVNSKHLCIQILIETHEDNSTY